MSRGASTSGEIPRPSPGWLIVGYGVMLPASVGLFLLIRAYGETLSGPAVATTAEAPPPAARTDVLLHVLLALAAIIVAGRGLGKLFVYIGQPPVIGEVVAGILSTRPNWASWPWAARPRTM